MVRGHTHQHATDQHQDTTDNVPRLEVAELCHQMTTGKYRRTEHHDQWEKPHCCGYGAVAARKLEVQRNVVDGDEPRSIDGGCTAKQKNSVPVAEEMRREDASCGAGEDGVGLLDAKEDEERKRDDKEGHNLPAVPRVQCATEVDGQNEGCDSADGEDRAGEVELAEQSCGFAPCAGLEGRDVEEVDRGKKARDAEIDVKGPAPCGGGLYKGTADDGAKNSADAPDETDEAKVSGTLAI